MLRRAPVGPPLFRYLRGLARVETGVLYSNDGPGMTLTSVERTHTNREGEVCFTLSCSLARADNESLRPETTCPTLPRVDVPYLDSPAGIRRMEPHSAEDWLTLRSSMVPFWFKDTEE